MVIKEIIVYSLVAISSLTLLAYTVHMFIGGLVSKQTEYLVMAVVVIIGAAAMAVMAWDVVRRRRAGLTGHLDSAEDDQPR